MSSEAHRGATSEAVLRAHEIVKSYGHVRALRGVSFDVRAGEVHALVGDNGAGKSTLVKVLAGAVPADSGTITIDGKPASFKRPEEARDAGIETVYQDLAVAETLDLGENIFLGREPLRGGLLGKLGFVDRRKMRQQGAAQLRSLGTQVPSAEIPLESFSGGQKQAVAIARAAVWGRKVLLLDEPAAALGVKQTRQVLNLIRSSAESRLAVVFISHNIPQVLEVADRITVLMRGRVALHCDRGDATTDQLVRAMSGFAMEGVPS